MCLPVQEVHPALTVAYDAQDAHLLIGGSFVQQATHQELAASSAPAPVPAPVALHNFVLPLTVSWFFVKVQNGLLTLFFLHMLTSSPTQFRDP